MSPLKSPSPFGRRTWIFTLLAGALWLLTYLARPHLMKLPCYGEPTHCTSQEISTFDAVALGTRNLRAATWSDQTQAMAGIAALLIPMAFDAVQVASGALPTGAISRLLGQRLLLLTEAAFWNGALNNTVRLVVQRPRPYLYNQGGTTGNDPSDYTSFYSGHTSFAALAGLMLWFFLSAAGAPPVLKGMGALVGLAITVTTAVLRVLSGFHFPTDTLAGMLAGALVAWVVLRVHGVTAKKQNGRSQ